MTPTPKAYVKSALSHIGLQCGAVGHPYVSTPYWSHAIIQWLVDHIGTEWFWMNYTHSALGSRISFPFRSSHTDSCVYSLQRCTSTSESAPFENRNASEKLWRRRTRLAVLPEKVQGKNVSIASERLLEKQL